MAHCAEIDNQSVVKRVIVVEDFYGNLTCEEWCEKTYGGMWKKTSYNTHKGKHLLGGTPFRKNYAGIGYKYHQALDAFIPQKPFDSWLFNEETCSWDPPTPMPKKGLHRWDEKTINWIKL